MPASSKIVSQVHCAWQRIQRDLKLAGIVEKEDKFFFVSALGFIQIYIAILSHSEIMA